jgi:hypothetical protein
MVNESMVLTSGVIQRLKEYREACKADSAAHAKNSKATFEECSAAFAAKRLAAHVLAIELDIDEEVTGSRLREE